jgi:hypothetical protein
VVDQAEQDIIRAKLGKWQNAMMEVEAQYDALAAVVGCVPESPLFEAISRLKSAYTNAVAQLVCDEHEWLEWWWLECDFGRRGKTLSATMPNGEVVYPSSTSDMAYIILGNR